MKGILMTDYLQEHLKILKLAVEGKLPYRIDEQSGVELHIVKELVDLDLLKALDASDTQHISFLEPSITIPGREYLMKLEERKKERTFVGKVTKFFPKLFAWIFGILATLIGGLLIIWLGKLILKQ
jgi:hypothetical protein